MCLGLFGLCMFCLFSCLVCFEFVLALFGVGMVWYVVCVLVLCLGLFFVLLCIVVCFCFVGCGSVFFCVLACV